MLKKLLFLILCCLPLVAHPASSLHQKLAQATAGDYIVTAIQGHYTLLFIRSLTADTLVLEEVTVPGSLIDLKNFQWQEWLDNRAPGHTSWMLYNFDRKKGTLTECFSYHQNGWIYLTEEEQFLSRLIHLPLTVVPAEERKKIGAPPPGEEMDRRPFWNPPIVIKGKKVSKPSVEVYSTRWPKDQSPLSLCVIELYFNREDPTFAFPYWIEVKSPHYAFKMRTVDSGKNLHSSALVKAPSKVMNRNSPIRQLEKSSQ